MYPSDRVATQQPSPLQQEALRKHIERRTKMYNTALKLVPPETKKEPPAQLVLPRPDPPRRVPGENVILHIQRTVAYFYHVSMSGLLVSGRRMCHQRHVSMYLCKTLADKTLQEIGARHGGRDHATVFHAVQKTGWLIGERGGTPPKHFAHKADVPIDEVLVGQIECLKGLLKDL